MKKIKNYALAILGTFLIGFSAFYFQGLFYRNFISLIFYIFGIIGTEILVLGLCDLVGFLKIKEKKNEKNKR